MEVIPLRTVPLTGVSTASTVGIPSVETPSATPLTALEKTVELEKSMEEMNLQETEISKLKKEVENLHELKSSYQTSYSKEKQTLDKLKQELQQLQKQTVAGKTLIEVKESVWMDITKSVNEIWPMVQIMFEKNELVQRSKQAIEKIRG
jgi:DNA repair ATPase RecN